MEVLIWWYIVFGLQTGGDTLLRHLFFEILFLDLVSDDILQITLGSDLQRKFGERILHSLLTNII